MMSGFSTVMVSGLAVGINTTYTVAHGHDPFPTMFAGSLFMGGCVLVSGLSPEIGTALAWLFLLGTLLTRGAYFMDWLSSLTSGAGKSKKNG